MQKTVVYICEGTCKAQISEEQFTNGLTQCGTEGCTLKGHTFKKILKTHKGYLDNKKPDGILGS